MKIGILSYWNSDDNYGQQLQCFAMQTFLKTLGHEPYHIRYIGKSPEKARFKFSKIFRYILHINTYLKLVLKNKREKEYANSMDNSQRHFDDFRKQFLNLSDRVYSAEELMANPPEADAFIAGSDQIWRGDEIYYLPFVRKGTKKISYAPSFGARPIFSAEEASRLRSLLGGFDLLTVRETSGEDALKKIGLTECQTVVDPAMLIDAETYRQSFRLTDREKNGIFVYLLGNETRCSVGKIFDFIEKSRKPYTYVASQGQLDNYRKMLAGVPEWLDGIMNAELVITNSFHCVVMALIFERPFIFMPLGGKYSRMNDRLTDLLGKVGLLSRIHDQSFDDIPDDIDFSAFRDFVTKERERSTKLLDKVLN